MTELLDSYRAAQTLQSGGKVLIGELGFLSAEKTCAQIFNFDDAGECLDYRVTSSKYKIKFTPSAKLRKNMD